MPLSPLEERELALLLDREKALAFGHSFIDEWDFLCRGVWTVDEATGKVRKFPGHLEYLREIVSLRRECIDKRTPLIVEKSRRMFVTWLFLSLYLFDTLTEKNHANFVGSRKLETSAYLLGPYRMWGIYDRIPEKVWPHKPKLVQGPRFEGGYRRLICPDTGSFVEAIASGSDQLRQYTASNVLYDEFAFWDKARESWEATVPVVQGGGHIDVLSTAELGSYMYDLIYDTGRI